MPEVELILKADNSQYVNSVKEAQKATEDLHKSASEGTKREKGLIQDIEGEIKRLEDARRKAWRVEDIEKYNRKIAEAKKDLQDYMTTGVGANATMSKSTDKLSEAFGGLLKRIAPITIAIAAMTKVLKGAWEAFKDTTLGLKLVTAAGELWRQMTYNIAVGNLNMTKSFALSGVIAGAIHNLRIQERKDLIINAQLQKEYNKTYFEAMDRTMTDVERRETLNKALQTHNKLIENQIRNANQELDILELQLANRPKSNKLMDQEAQLRARIINLQGQQFSQTRLLESQITGLDKAIREKMFQDYFKWLEKQNEIQDKTKELINKFLDVEVSMITDPLERLRAQRDMQLKGLRDWLNDLLFTLGTLTPEQEAMVQKMADAIQLEFLKAMSDVSPADTAAVTKSVGDALNIILPVFDAGASKKLRAFKGTFPERKDSIWNIIGIDPESEKGQEMIESIRDTASAITDTLSTALDNQVQLATRRRELLDREINETQNMLAIETQLYEAGYANNVTARRKELAELKKLRAQAMKDEEDAIRRQMIFEASLQAINLITTSTELIKSLVKSFGPLGLLAAIPVIAGLFALFASAKSKSKSITKLAEGGTGTETGVVTGKSHNEGGEGFLSHVEVERGERWGVLSRGASEKYGKIFDRMVYSFNRDEMPDIVQTVPVNNINVDNNGSNSRLDKVIAETRRMNAREGLTVIGNKKIITKGNKVRIVG